MPYRFVPRDDRSARRFSLSENSVGAEVFRRRSTISMMIQKSLQMSGFDQAEADRVEQERLEQLRSKQLVEEKERPISSSLKSPLFWCIVGFLSINDFRVTSILGMKLDMIARKWFYKFRLDLPVDWVGIFCCFRCSKFGVQPTQLVRLSDFWRTTLGGADWLRLSHCDQNHTLEAERRLFRGRHSDGEDFFFANFSGRS